MLPYETGAKRLILTTSRGLQSRRGALVRFIYREENTTSSSPLGASISSEPVLIEVAIEPKTIGGWEKMAATLNRLTQEDPSFRFASDPESGQTVIKGMDELHLEIIVDRIKREVAVNVGAPQVAYRETITRTIEQDYTHKKQTGGAGQYAKVKIRFEPLPPRSGFVFENKVVAGAVPRELVTGVEKGLKAAKEVGVIAGFPMIDFKATLIDGDYHDVDSNVMTFDIAARACYREGIPKASPKLLEPIMRVEVVTPDEYMGDVIGDLNSRRGQIDSMHSRGNARLIGAMVPLANMFGYVSTLRSMSQSRAQYTMRFDRYAPTPSPDDDGPFSPAIGMRA